MLKTSVRNKMPRLPPPPANGDNYEPMDLDLVETDESDDLPVLDEVDLDLENYICHFHGLPRIYRLEFIADHCKSLRIEALTMAVNYITKNTCNVKDYTRLFGKLQDAYRRQLRNSSLVMDNEWIDRKTKQVALRFERLESDITNSRHSTMKDNLRRGQDDLGYHYLDCGELENAFNAFLRSRDFATNQSNQIKVCLNIIRVSILLKRWGVVLNHVLRAESQPTNDSPTNSAVSTTLHCAAGLFELNQRRYKKAAKLFLSTNFDHFSQSNSSPASSSSRNTQAACSSGSSSNFGSSSNSFISSISGPSAERDIPASPGHWEILAPVNIAVYGSLCALATYSRQELANHLINSASFKQFAELDPQLREAVSRFYESKYASCLSILEEMKNTLLLDMYLAPHVERLYRAIRSKALVQYFEPYSSASMDKMARAFNTTVDELEGEIISLIYDGLIKARIDSHNKILFAKNTDSRSQTFERAIKFGKLWQRHAQALITRTAILNAGLVINSTTLPDRSGF